MAGNLTIGALLTLGTDRLRGPRTPVGAAPARNRDITARLAANDTTTHTLDAELLLVK